MLHESLHRLRYLRHLYCHQESESLAFKKGSCNTKTLLLPTRNIRTTLFDICMITIWHSVNKFIRTGKMAGPLTLFLCCILITPAEVIENCTGEKNIFCNTTETSSRSVSISYSLTSFPPTSKRPSETSYRRLIELTRLDFALPVPPMIPIVSPSLIERSISFNTFSCPLYYNGKKRGQRQYFHLLLYKPDSLDSQYPVFHLTLQIHALHLPHS